MRVDGLIYADDEMIEQIKHDQALEQVVNVAFLPGIQHASLAMPDIHWGYGFPIGGVAATAVLGLAPESVVGSPGQLGGRIEALGRGSRAGGRGGLRAAARATRSAAREWS